MKKTGGIKADKNDSLMKDLIQIIFCVVCLIICALTFSWFTMQTDSTAIGATVTAYAPPSITVARVTGGADILTLPEGENKLIVDPEKGSEILPGSNGSFDMYLTSNFTSTYNMDCTIIPYELTPGQSAFRTDNVDLQELGLRYIKTHIACFLSYDPVTGVYSDWINNTDGININVLNSEVHYTVYWIWFETYSDISAARVAATDLAAIHDYINNEPAEYFDRRNDTTALEDAGDDKRFVYYNYADEDIGMSLDRICFELSFVPR